MIIDTHIHEKTYSSDSFMSLEEIVARAQAIGLAHQQEKTCTG